MRWLCAALLILAGIGPAAADIRINTSRYADGTLTIAGHTEAGKTVVLDGKYKTKSNADGDFTFTEHYKPSDCMSDIRSGSSDYGAVIAGCFAADVSGDANVDIGSIDKMVPAGSPNAPLPVKKVAIKPKG